MIALNDSTIHDDGRTVSYTIRTIVGWHHVRTPYLDILRDIRQRAIHNAQMDYATRKPLYQDALIAHKRNREDYRWIMSGFRTPHRSNN